MDRTTETTVHPIEEIENRVLKGLVLDKRGAWVPIADCKSTDQEYLAHLSAGQVLQEGCWVSIAEACAEHQRLPATIEDAAVDFPPETVDLSEVSAVAEGNETTIGPLSSESPPPESEFPPETEMIITESHRQNVEKPVIPHIKKEPPRDPEPAYFHVELSGGDIVSASPGPNSSHAAHEEALLPETEIFTIGSRRHSAGKFIVREPDQEPPRDPESAYFHVELSGGEAASAASGLNFSQTAPTALPPEQGHPGIEPDPQMQDVFLSSDTFFEEQEVVRRKRRALAAGLAVAALCAAGIIIALVILIR